MSRLGFTLFSCFALGALVCLILLGNWQMRRLDEKLALIDTVQTRIAGPAQSLSQIEALYNDTGDVDFHPIEVSGEFELENNDGMSAGEVFYLNTYKGLSGWNVYSPLRLEDGRYVIVNRGFVPDTLREPELRPQDQTSGPVSFKGLSRKAPSEKPSSIMPDNDLEKNQFFWKYLPEMKQVLGLVDKDVLPFFVDAGAQMTAASGYPLAGTTRVSFTNNHLSYALTWYGLALTLWGVYIAVMMRYAKQEQKDA